MIKLSINCYYFQKKIIKLINLMKQNTSMTSGISVPVDAGLDELRLARQPGVQVSHSAKELGRRKTSLKGRRGGCLDLSFSFGIKRTLLCCITNYAS